MKKSIVFKINDESYLKIDQSGEFEEWFRYDEVTITFFNKNDQYIVFSNDFLIYAIRMLQGTLEEIFDQHVSLDKSIQLDIGYLWNEYLQDKPLKLKYVKKENIDHWVGKDYLLWSSNNGSTETWIYNKDSKIYLEITPSYSWHFSDPEPNNKDYITYDEFIKNYKPIAILEIDKDIAKQWLTQIDELLKIIEENDKLYFD